MSALRAHFQRAAFLLATLLPAGVALAHDPFASTINAVVDDTGVQLEVRMTLSATVDLFPGKPPVVAEETFPVILPQLKQIAVGLVQISSGATPLVADRIEVSLTEENDAAFHVHYARVAGNSLLFRAAYLAKMPAEHVATLYVSDPAGNNLNWNYLDAASPALSVTVPGSLASPVSAPTPRFVAFFLLGIRHIRTGFDHLLFLGGLLVACRSFHTMAGIITCFTVAHSITLALAALGWVVISSRIVEPLIAASIVFVGVENLLRRDTEPKGRWALTFVFGLVHGLGFAGALREAGVGAGGSSLLVPLVSFNLGIETGQLAIAAVTLPLLLKLRSRPSFVRYGLPAASSVVIVLGSYWLLQRTVFA